MGFLIRRTVLLIALASGCWSWTSPGVDWLTWRNCSYENIVLPKIYQPTNDTSTIIMEGLSWSTARKLTFHPPFPNIAAANLLVDGQRRPIAWVFTPDTSELKLEMPPGAYAPSARIIVEKVEKSRQFADGRIVFSALDADIEGHARLVSNRGDHHIGFWTSTSDSINWSYQPTRWGMYDVELTFSARAGVGTEVRLDIGGKSFLVVRPLTGSWNRYQTIPVGRFYLAKAERFTVRAQSHKITGTAVMNLKAVTLHPAPEGQPVSQDASGSIVLHARDATTHSQMMRYEPQPNKNCLGYWVNPSDWAEWVFSVKHAGTFDVEIWQGCGKGQGGSEVLVEAAGQTTTFVVEETGHFQNFIPRKLPPIHLPRPGEYSLAVRPQSKKAAAVMDVREIRLKPRPHVAR